MPVQVTNLVSATKDNTGVQQRLDGTWTARNRQIVTFSCLWGTDHDNLFASSGELMRFNGATWEVLGAPSAGPIGNIKALWGSSTTDLWIGSQRGTATDGDWALDHWDGSSFSHISLSPGLYNAIFGIWGSSASDVYAVGYTYDGSSTCGLVWHFDGATWSESLNVANARFTVIHGSDSSNVFVAGYQTGSPYTPVLYRLSGGSWSLQTLPNTPVNAYGSEYYGFRSIWAYDANNVYVGGVSKPSSTYYATLWKWNGSTWSTVRTDAGASIGTQGYDVCGTSLSNFWISTQFYTFTSYFPYLLTTYTYRWNGSSWEYAPRGGALAALKETYIVGGTAFAVSYAGILKWSGSRWELDQSLNMPLSGAGFTAVWGTSSSDFWALNNGRVWRFESGAFYPLDWSTLQDALAIWGSSNSDVYVLTTAGNNYRWNGTSWITLPNWEGGSYYMSGVSVWGLSSSAVWIIYSSQWIYGGGGTRYLKFWNGATWSTVSYGSGYKPSYIWGTDDLNLYIGGAADTTSYTKLMHSTNGNAGPWNQVTEVVGTGACLISGSSANDIFAMPAGAMTSFNTYHWDGATWTQFTDIIYPRAMATLSSSATFVATWHGDWWMWNGTAWTIERHGEMLAGVVAVGSDILGYGLNFRTYDGSWGDLWLPRHFGGAACVFALSDGTFYVGVNEVHKIWYWNGSSWEMIIFPGQERGSGSTDYPIGVAVSIWTDGATLFIGDDCSRVHILSGGSWTTHLLPTSYSLNRRVYSLAGFDASDLYAAVDNKVYHWDGSSWTLVLTHPVSGAYTYSLAVDSGKVYALFGNGTIYRWDGSSWSSYCSGASGDTLFVAGDGSKLWCHQSGSSAQSPKHSVDRGATWTTIVHPLYYMWSTLDYPVFGHANTNYLETSQNGSTWTRERVAVYGAGPLHGLYEFISPVEYPAGSCRYGAGRYGTPMYGNCALEDANPPYLQNLSPASGSTHVSVHTDIIMEIVDDETGVNLNTVKVWVQGVLAWSDDLAQPGFTGRRTIVPKGFRYTIAPSVPFAVDEHVAIRVVAVDLADPTMDVTYYFDTAAESNPPFLRNRTPVPFQTGVVLSPAISVDILDDVGVVASSIDAYVDGALVYDGAAGSFVSPFDGSVTPTVVDGYSGYHVAFSSSASFAPSTAKTVRIVARDVESYLLDESWLFRTAGAVLRLEQGSYEITLDALFSGPMLLSSLLDASLYQLSDGAYVRDVEPLPDSSSPTGVRLWVEGFQGPGPFTLTVSSLVRDAYGDALAPDGRTAQISPFQSTALFSNTDGLVRSWHESRVILRDGQRAYLGGTRGLDAFGILPSVSRSSRWAQILDSYGVVAACLSGSDYVFADTDPPFLADRHPAPGETGVSPYATIRLSVADELTSVEIVQLAVYVRNTSIAPANELVFSGAYGWTNPTVCGGLITVGRQLVELQLFLKRPLDVGPVVVTVLASDLAGNSMVSSYTFTVGGGPIVLGGFGEGSFGEDPFGE